MKSTSIYINKKDIKMKFMVETMEYIDVNSFVKDTGVTVKNISFPIKGHFIRLKNLGDTFVCGNILTNFFVELKKEINNDLIIIDFDGVEEISENFLKNYTKILLESSNKIITINMNTALSNDFARFIENSVTEE